MRLSPSELEELIQFLKLRSEWSSLPSWSAIWSCREHAEELIGHSEDPSDEVAAMFFALSHDESKLRGEHRQLPCMLIWHYADWLGFDLSDEDVDYLPDLQDEIADGSVEWPEARGWFKLHLVPLKQ